uniref:Retrotransposon Copia-like N-terminal domain-containing protein n=1 Tax=Cajanus cajan TaxID=3821 RepID=A0A151TDY6_CAJCA|nr:hypothetical protein KK1_011447 [Cajanus cajan]
MKKSSRDAKPLSAITLASPYYLSSLDNLGTPLVATTLKGDNYRTWARSMRTTLHAKSKLAFIDGIMKKPMFHSQDFQVLEKTNSMVLA